MAITGDGGEPIKFIVRMNYTLGDPAVVARLAKREFEAVRRSAERLEVARTRRPHCHSCTCGDS